MDFSYYIFAFFVFVLIGLIVLMAKKIKTADAKNEKTVSEKEKKLFKLFQSLDEMISEAKEFIEEAKDDISTDKKEIKSMLAKADDIYREARYEMNDKLSEIAASSKPSKKAAPEKKKAPPAKPFSELTRNEQVRLLKKEGRSIEEISKELSISQGEVALIIGLNR